MLWVGLWNSAPCVEQALMPMELKARGEITYGLNGVVGADSKL